MSLVDYLKSLYPPHRKRLARIDSFGDDAAIAILENRDLTALTQLFRAIPTNWSDRYFYSLAMSRRFPIELLRGWVKSEPSSADAHLVYGARLLKWSWDARGYGRGREISEEQWIEFYRRLELTRAALEKCAELQPEDPTPWAYLIMVAVYHGDGEELQQNYFEHAIRRDPDNWIAHMHRLTGLTEKYGGSHTLMFDFAYKTVADAKDGSLLPILLTKAHSEYWKYLALFEGNYVDAVSHAQQRFAQDETIDAYQRSLGSHPYDTRESVFARINAAGWFWICQKREPLRGELLELGDSVDAIHWRWVGTEETFKKAQQFALGS